MIPKWTTALPDWEDKILKGKSLVPCPPLFPLEAEAALEVFKSLRIVDAVGSPTMGEACRDWVFDYVAAIFGAYDPDRGRRLINDFFLLISKKNSKSTIAAGIMLTALIRNWRQSAEFLILAPTIEVANNSYKPASDMVRHDPVLRTLLHVQDHYRTITHRNTGATLKVVAADNETVGGKKAVGVLIDELWMFGKKPNAEDMLREATGGLASRPEGFTIALSTQSDQPPAGVFKQALDDFRDIRDGKLKAPRRMGVLYEYPEKMLKAESYLSHVNWHITNPNLGVSVDEEFLADQRDKADRAGPSSVAGFLAKHLNVEIGMNLRANRWPGAEYWDRRADRSITRQSLMARCDVIVAAIDGGGLDDLLGFGLLGRDKATKDWLLWSHAWCHRSVLERRKSIATTLEGFAAAGELTIVDDDLGDVSDVVAIVEEVLDRGLLHCVAVDPAGIGEIVDAMASIGVTVENKMMIGVSQGYRMMNAIKTGERRLAAGTFRHSGSSLMVWCIGNLKIEATQTAIRATKMIAGDAKIDPAMAMFNAIDVMSMNPESATAQPQLFFA